MVNSWSLLGSILNGTFDEDYPIVKKKSSKNVSEATKEDYQDFWEEDGFSVTGDTLYIAPANYINFENRAVYNLIIQVEDNNMALTPNNMKLNVSITILTLKLAKWES